MAKNTQRDASKAIAKLGKQTGRRQAVGRIRDEVKEQTTHSTRRLAYDLNGEPH